MRFWQKAGWLIFGILVVQPGAYAQTVEKSPPLEVTVKPYELNAKAVMSVDQLYMDMGDGVRISFGEWLRRSFGGNDEIISGRAARVFYELGEEDYNPARLNEDGVAVLLSPRFQGKSFVNIGLALGYDAQARAPGISLSRGIYGPKPIAPIDVADEQLGAIDLSGGKYRLRDFLAK